MFNTFLQMQALARIKAGGGGLGTWTANDVTLSAKDGNLVAYWNMNEASGNRIDSIGSYVATDNNTVGSATGINSNGADAVSANSEYLSIATTEIDLAQVWSTKTFGISLWIKTAETARRGILANDRFGTGFSVDCNASVAGDIRFNWNTGANFSTGDISISDNNLHHIFFVVDGSNVDCWHNGSSVINTTNATSLTDNGQATFLFNYNNSGSPFAGEYLDGLIDEVAIWDIGTGLDGTFATALYNSGTGAFYTG